MANVILPQMRGKMTYLATDILITFFPNWCKKCGYH